MIRGVRNCYQLANNAEYRDLPLNKVDPPERTMLE